MNLKNFKRSLSILIVLILTISLLPMSTLAAQPHTDGSALCPVKLSDTDYSNKNNWLSFNDRGMDVDIFAVYPTVTNSPNPADLPFVQIENPMMRELASNWLNSSASAVTYAGNVYAPLYRQLNGAKLSDLDSAGFEKYTFATPRDDVFTAFDYFLKHVNKNKRPFILVGSSQGAALVAECASLLLGDEDYRKYNKNHIATYAIGFSVTEKTIARNSNLKFAESKNDTGVILSWNTTAPSEIKSGAYKKFGTWNPDALTINPITWTTSPIPVSAETNRSSKLLQADGSYKMVKAYADATVDYTHKVLVAKSVPEADYKSIMPTISKYHPYDMLFYYNSIKKNVADRIAAFGAR